uniref:RuBisCO large subunit-binding protein subunit beta n=1 Tax=Arundo donax TaxID=35708 RepID=A0A0A9FIU5_ARUDO
MTVRSPKPGALIAAIFNAPLSLLTTRVARASCSISSATIRIGYPPLTASSRIVIRSLALLIFLSTRSSLQFSYSTDIFSLSVTK